MQYFCKSGKGKQIGILRAGGAENGFIENMVEVRAKINNKYRYFLFLFSSRRGERK